MTSLYDAEQQALLALFRQQTSQTSQALLKQYSVRGPRYTSYPTVPAWTERFDSSAYATALQQAFGNVAQAEGMRAAHAKAPITEAKRALSLYVHLPFCEERCLFCSCNTVITKQRELATDYFIHLYKEFELVARQIMPEDRLVQQLHWGGGTPTYHSAEQLAQLLVRLRYLFPFDADAELALEVDPRVTTVEQLSILREAGFNRISMGVQDFNPQVQKAVQREQSYEQTEHLLKFAKALGYSSTNLDLIYGLPHQTLESFSATIDQVLALSPERIALYNFAYVPWLSPWQKYIAEDTLPDGEVKFAIFQMAVQRLMEAGYHYIGMDHFSKPDDELSVAQSQGKLHRNFMGYTTRSGEADLLGFGVSAISTLDGAFAQNLKQLPRYYAAIDEGRLPTWRGCTLSQEDKLRRAIIKQLLCESRLDLSRYEQAYQINFRQHFAVELEALKQAEADGLVRWQSEHELVLQPLGRVFARNVAMLFDAYLPKQQASDKPIFSKTL